MKTKIFLLSVLLITFFASCKNDKNNGAPKPIGDRGYTVEFAKGFSVLKTSEYTEVTVHDPWDSTKVLQTYILIDKAKELPANLPQGIVIRTPLEKVAVSSTVQCSSLAELASDTIIKGARDVSYINEPLTKKRIQENAVVDLGTSALTNVEIIIDLNAEAIFVEPMKGMGLGELEKIKTPVILTPDYMENSALGRAEWLRFYSLFVAKETLADSLFETTRNNYNNIKDLVSDTLSNPTLLVEMMYNKMWNVAAGQSTMANMYKDAGAAYLWADNTETGSLTLNFETVLDKAESADVWLIKYFNETDLTYKSLEKEYKGYALFNAFEKKNIYGCNMKYSLFYEDLPIHPDYILKELVAIFHPQLYPDYELKYFKKLE